MYPKWLSVQSCQSLVHGSAIMSDCALHLSRPDQCPIKYFMGTAFFEVAWEGYYATTITKLFAKKFCCVPHALHAAVYTRL